MRPSRSFACAVAVLVAVLAGSLLLPRGTQPPPLEPGRSPAEPASTAAASGGTAGLERQPATPTTTPAVERQLVVRGRCLAAEDGRAVVATVRIGRDEGGLIEQVGTLANEPLAVTTTDANGEFSCAVAIDGETNLRVHAEAPGRAPAGARDRSSPGDIWELGDIRLVRTTAVRGVVVDTSGAPVAGAEVGIVMIGHDPPALQFRESHSALTDGRGEFVFGDPVATGEWYVRVERTGALRAPRKLQTEAGQPLDVRIEVERPDPALALHGQVVDGSGNPLAGVALSVYGAGARGSAESDADGRFVVHKGPPHPDQGEPGLDLQASRAGFEQTSPRKNEITAWGRRDVQVVMRPLGDLVVRAVDAHGSMVWPFTLTIGKVSANGAAWSVRRPWQQQAGEGHIVLPRLPTGSYSLVLEPEDRALATAGPVRFSVDEHSERELLVRVASRTEVQVLVVDGSSGAPIPGCTVELLASLTANPADGAGPAPDLAAVRAGASPSPRQVAMALASTDAGGAASLTAAPGPWLLRARCVSHQPLALAIVAAPNGGVHRLALTAAAVLHCDLQPRELLPALGLGQAKPERRLAVVALVGRERVGRAEVAADGSFVLGPLPPVRVALQLTTWLAANAVSNTALPHALGDIDGAVAGRIDRTFDVGPLAPATVRGVVLWDGQPMRNSQFFLSRLQPEPVHSVRVPTDGDGRFETLVPGGMLGAMLAIPSDPGPGHVSLPLDERHAVAAGGSLELRIAAAPRSLRLRLLRPDGEPMAHVRVQVVGSGHQRPGRLETDAGGRVDVPLAPYGEFTVTTKTADGVSWSGRVGAAATASVVGIDVTLAPEAK